MMNTLSILDWVGRISAANVHAPPAVNFEILEVWSLSAQDQCIGVESCTVVFLGGHVLFTCSDTCCKMYIVYPQCTASQRSSHYDANGQSYCVQYDRLEITEYSNMRWRVCGRQASDLASHITRFQNDIHRCVGMIQDPQKLKEQITSIYFTHVQDNFVRRLHDYQSINQSINQTNSVYTPCPEKRGQSFFPHNFNKCSRHSFVIFGTNHPEDSFY